MRSSPAGRIRTDKDRPRQMLGMESYLDKGQLWSLSLLTPCGPGTTMQTDSGGPKASAGMRNKVACVLDSSAAADLDAAHGSSQAGNGPEETSPDILSGSTRRKLAVADSDHSPKKGRLGCADRIFCARLQPYQSLRYHLGSEASHTLCLVNGYGPAMVEMR